MKVQIISLNGWYDRRVAREYATGSVVEIGDERAVKLFRNGIALPFTEQAQERSAKTASKKTTPTRK